MGTIHLTIRKILSVDDSEADQYLNTMRIKEAEPEAEVRCAADGEQALEMLREPGYSPDLVLLDINMPRMDGFEFLEAYAEEFKDDVPAVVLIMTSSNQQADRERTAKFPFVKGFYLKPLAVGWRDEIEQLLDKVDSD